MVEVKLKNGVVVAISEVLAKKLIEKGLAIAEKVIEKRKEKKNK
jgi:exosome complex RNA-binding protein Rrp4